LVSTTRTTVVLFVMGLSCTSLSADAAKDAWRKCSKANDAETKLRECSVAVESGTLSKDIVANALLIRASAYDERGDYDRAIKDLDESVKLNPSASRSIDTRGWEYVRKFDYKQAIRDFDQSIQLDPKNDYAYSNRGIARFLSGDFANAESDFAMSERLAPKALRAYPALKRTLAHLRDDKEKGVKADASPVKIEGDPTQWPGQIVAYYTGVISREAVLHAAQVPFENERKWKLCQAYFYLGEHALIEGKREEARELLQESIDTEAKSDPEYVLAEGELRNLRSLGNGDITREKEK
jgi:lipoprotein NlpI